MKEHLNVLIPIAPMPCPRPRVALRGRVPVAYYPKEYQSWKAQVAEAFRLVRGDTIVGPVEVSIICAVERPKTTKLFAPKPDADNYGKAVLDAMTQAGVWNDDTQVVRVLIEKRWTQSGEKPCVYVRVRDTTVPRIEEPTVFPRCEFCESTL